MLRLTELALFLAPFALFAIWMVYGRRLARLAWPALAVALALGALLIGFGLHRSLSRDTVYVPARLRNGMIVDSNAP